MDNAETKIFLTFQNLSRMEIGLSPDRPWEVLNALQ